MCCAIFGFTIGAADAIIYGFMSHIKAQFLILIHSLETFLDRTQILLNKDGYEIDLEKYKNPKKLPNGLCLVEKLPGQAQKYADYCISDIIQHHQEILDLADGCEHTFSWLLLVQFAGSCLLICMQLYQLSIFPVLSIPFCTMSCYLFLMSTQIVLFCWHGNEVKLISDEIADVAFHSNWLVTELKTQKSILLMITRSIRPVRLTAGKFIFLSLESFMSLMKGSGSYFMFLKKMNQEE
ncbi:odorant receptor 10-like [Onthophagus taurus]|uniref:odorant receptor 10-like n=1 Tax=Onthophagus taurus TaxID=166361 RepID=UPI0039BE563F